MGNEYRAKVFKSGNSVALRLPKALGLKDGDEMLLREERGSFIVEPAPVARRKIDLTGIWGSCPDLKPLTPEERLFDDPPRIWDDPEWKGWQGDDR
ncbi:AbrB/MazE/SpoVT family DNA-binding domain-containing protein [Sphingomonas sp. S6]|jgi:antitoxin VapB|uniref:AbrB/MazE/SpoVT family DNA-binding domain-containing protein n=1 Tax=Sphingomonas sp. S6 TaxID=3368600 RepID=UPI000FBCDB03|nr:AbrB/MazE/SpoVT family DNA-binding domain-containing protein [uncultured Sphingomonas sp.]RTL17569.1 MAG: AbrB/MazE/SpoVT family DNA-binding domain-containing protein [Sphingomonadaceae bacterium]